jgi:hypothetical protein
VYCAYLDGFENSEILGMLLMDNNPGTDETDPNSNPDSANNDGDEMGADNSPDQDDASTQGEADTGDNGYARDDGDQTTDTYNTSDPRNIPNVFPEQEPDGGDNNDA